MVVKEKGRSVETWNLTNGVRFGKAQLILTVLPLAPMAKSSKRSSKAQNSRHRGETMVFDRRNYMLLSLGVAAIIVGFAIMRIENAVDGFLSLYVAPLLLLGGYLEIIYAILWRPKRKEASAEA